MKLPKYLTTVTPFSKYLALSLFVILPLTTFMFGYLVGKNTPQDTHTPTVAKHVSSPISISTSPTLQPISWHSYKNTIYAYAVSYPNTTSYKETTSSEYENTIFLDGCFIVFAVPLHFDNQELQRTFRIPWTHLDELEQAQIGSTNTYPFAEGKDAYDKPFTFTSSFKKLPAKQIGGIDWNTFETQDNWEDIGLHYTYFVSKNNRRYIIDMRSKYICPDNEPFLMLETFKFIN